MTVTLYVLHDSQVFTHDLTERQAETYIATSVANFPNVHIEVK